MGGCGAWAGCRGYCCCSLHAGGGGRGGNTQPAGTLALAGTIWGSPQGVMAWQEEAGASHACSSCCCYPHCQAMHPFQIYHYQPCPCCCSVMTCSRVARWRARVRSGTRRGWAPRATASYSRAWARRRSAPRETAPAPRSRAAPQAEGTRQWQEWNARTWHQLGEVYTGERSYSQGAWREGTG
jgi:hypothetical protein